MQDYTTNSIYTEMGICVKRICVKAERKSVKELDRDQKIVYNEYV